MRRAWFWTGLVLLVGGCSLDYEKDQVTPADQVPQLVFDGLKQTAVKDGRVLYTMESDRTEVYQAKKQMRLKDFHFQEYDFNGQPASRGDVGAAVIDTTSNDARISGRLMARSEDQGVTLSIDGGDEGGLTWTNEDRILKTAPGTAVRLSKDDGSQVDAQALTLDLGSNRLEMEAGVQGTWTPETKNNAKSPATASTVPQPDAPQ